MQLDFGENMAGVTEVSVDLDLLAKRLGGNRTLVLRLEHTEIVDTANHAFNNYFPGLPNLRVFSVERAAARVALSLSLRPESPDLWSVPVRCRNGV